MKIYCAICRRWISTFNLASDTIQPVDDIKIVILCRSCFDLADAAHGHVRGEAALSNIAG